MFLSVGADIASRVGTDRRYRAAILEVTFSWRKVRDEKLSAAEPAA